MYMLAGAHARACLFNGVHAYAGARCASVNMHAFSVAQAYALAYDAICACLHVRLHASIVMPPLKLAGLLDFSAQRLVVCNTTCT